jgi:hypothetical protein
VKRGLLYLINVSSPPRFTFRKGKDAGARIEAQKRKETINRCLMRAWREKAGKTGKKPLTILHQAVINVAYA